jgi:hypothetical protein
MAHLTLRLLVRKVGVRRSAVGFIAAAPRFLGVVPALNLLA